MKEQPQDGDDGAYDSDFSGSVSESCSVLKVWRSPATNYQLLCTGNKT